MDILTKSQLGEYDNFFDFENTKSNFATSFNFLSLEQKKAIINLYNFCSYLDDIIDSSDNLNQDSVIEKKSIMNNWLQRFEFYYSGKEDSLPIQLSEIITKYSVPHLYFITLINGVSADLSKHSYQNIDDLMDYCYGVASIVGKISMHIFGDTSEKAMDYALNLGYALQLTNIIRDVYADAERNYFYIPQDFCEKYGFIQSEISKSENVDKLKLCLKELAALASNYYHNTTQILSEIKDKSAYTAPEIMKRVYYRLLQKIEKYDFNVSKKIKLSKIEKLDILLRLYISKLFN